MYRFRQDLVRFIFAYFAAVSLFRINIDFLQSYLRYTLNKSCRPCFRLFIEYQSLYFGGTNCKQRSVTFKLNSRLNMEVVANVFLMLALLLLLKLLYDTNSYKKIKWFILYGTELQWYLRLRNWRLFCLDYAFGACVSSTDPSLICMVEFQI
jgi:hypothetical protein